MRGPLVNRGLATTCLGSVFHLPSSFCARTYARAFDALACQGLSVLFVRELFALRPRRAMMAYAQKVSLPLSLPTMTVAWQRFSSASPMEAASPQVDVLIAQDEFKAFRDGICVRTSVETPASAHVRAHIHREPQRKSERERERE